MAPPPSTVVPPVVALGVRITTVIFLLISIIVLATNTTTTVVGNVELENKFSGLYAYRYIMAASVIGMLYTLLQIAFTVYFVSTGNRLGGDGFVLFDFFGDKALSYMLISAAAAGFGVAVDSKRVFPLDSASITFLNRGNAVASLVLVGFLFSAVSSIFSSFALPKKV